MQDIEHDLRSTYSTSFIKSGQSKGKKNFVSWYTNCLDQVRVNIRDNGVSFPCAQLSNEKSLRTMTPTQSEDITSFLKRVKTAAKEMKATWIFGCYITLARLNPDAPLEDFKVSTLDSLLENVLEQKIAPALMWGAYYLEGSNGLWDKLTPSPNSWGYIFTGSDKEILQPNPQEPLIASLLV